VVVEGYGEEMIERVEAAGYTVVWQDARSALLRRASEG
jgi:hypothetical protein